MAKTWSVNGGAVSVSCSDQTISLLYASPQDGWRVEIEKRGPDKVEVDLESAGAGTRVSATCVNGAPVATILANDGDH